MNPTRSSSPSPRARLRTPPGAVAVFVGCAVVLAVFGCRREVAIDFGDAGTADSRDASAESPADTTAAADTVDAARPIPSSPGTLLGGQLSDAEVMAAWGEFGTGNEVKPTAPPPPAPPPGRFHLSGFCLYDPGDEPDEEQIIADGKPYEPCWGMGNDGVVAAERVKKPKDGLRLWLNGRGREDLANMTEQEPDALLVVLLDDKIDLTTVDLAPALRDGFVFVPAKAVRAGLGKGEKLESLCFDNRPPMPDNVPAMPSPRPPAADVAALVQGNSRFALALLRELSKPPKDAKPDEPPKNLLFSPHSLSIALAMTYGGARGDTAKQMATTLDFTLAGEALHPAFASLAVQLDEAGRSSDGSKQVFELVVANSLWPQKGVSLEAPYLALTKRYYAVEIEAVDFAGDREAAVGTINQWVSTQTRERIPSLLDPKSIKPSTLLVLTNAVYFNATWDEPFKPGQTKPRVFHAPTGDVTVPTMFIRHPYRAAQVSVPLATDANANAGGAKLNVELLEMPYAGGRMALTVMMPVDGSLGDFVAVLSLEGLDELLAKLASEHLELSFPRFKLESGFELGPVLSAMGMPDAFGAKANFEGITLRELCIDQVVHKATIELDETGTIATAATAVVGVPYSLSNPTYRTLKIDRPFLYLIRDTGTGTILFVGLLQNPS